MHFPDEVEEVLSEDVEMLDGEVTESLDHQIWSTLANLNQSYGVSRVDLESVLDLIGKVAIAKVMPTLTNVNDFEDYQAQMVKDAPWTVSPKHKVDIMIDKSDLSFLGEESVCVEFYYEDMTHFLTMEFGDEAHRGHFVKHFQLVEDDAGARWVLDVNVLQSSTVCTSNDRVGYQAFMLAMQGLL